MATENFAKGRLGVLYTGGTIGCVGAPLAPLAGPAFAEGIRRAGLLAGADLASTPAPLDSSAMGPADWDRLARWVLRRDGPALILHGTDTMASSAAALAFLTTEIGADADAAPTPLARHGHRVVITGSQRPLFRPGGPDDGLSEGSDAQDNLAAAAARADLAARPRESLVDIVFGGRQVDGARALKVATLEDTAFAMPNGPAETAPLPTAAPGRLLAQLDEIAPHLGRRAVLSLMPVPGGSEALAEATDAAMDRLGTRLGALHLLGFGLGTWPCREAWGPVFDRAARRGIVVALGSQVPAGPVDPATYGAGAWLLDHGVVATRDMTAPAIGAKLQVLLALAAARSWDAEIVRRALVVPIAGEIAAP